MNFLQFVGLAIFYFSVRHTINYLRNPLRKFPGPFLAGFTYYYRAYYDVWKDGGFLDHLRELHAQYGPVVRTTPNELHFASTEAYFDIYHVGSKWLKDKSLYQVTGRPDSTFGYTDVVTAQRRRALLVPLFSRKAIFGIEDLIHEKVSKMIDRSISYYASTGKPVNLYRGFRCISQDIISQHAFGSCFNCLDSENFSHPMVENLKRSIHGVWLTRHFPWIQKALLKLSLCEATGTKNMRSLILSPFEVVYHQRNAPGFNEHSRKTMYHHLLSPPPGKGYTPAGRQSCLDEGMSIVGAGGENPGAVATIGVFFAYHQPDVLKKVQAEIRAAWPDLSKPAPRLEELEKLPLLTGVLKESLRFAVGAVTPMPRIVGPEDALVGGYTVPAGTIVAQAQSFMHENPNIFKNPEEFDPERWCQPDSKDLDHFLIAFSRGPRQCFGMHLALGELYIMYAHTFRKMDVEIYNTGPEDMKFRQYILPYFAGREFHGKVNPILN